MSNEELSVLREQVLRAIVSEDGQLDTVDTARLLNSEHFLARFLESRQGDLKKTVEAVLRCLKYRVKMGLINFTSADIAREVVETRNCQVGRDVNGKLYAYNYCGTYRRMPADVTRYFLSMAIYMNELTSLSERNVSLFVDISGFVWASLDIDFIRRTSEYNDACFPGFVDKVYIVCKSELFMSKVNFLLRLLPAKSARRVSFISKDEAKQIMGDMPMTSMDPKSCSTVEQIKGKFAISDADAMTWKAHLQWEREQVAEFDRQA